MRSMRLALVLLASLGLASCADMTPTQQSMGIGALGGAALGGVVGSFSGNAGLGALLGAGVGGAGGYLYGQSQQSRQPYYSGRNNGYRNNDGY
jgi:Glycine zipper